jgi:hypothetical protein
MNQFDEVWIGKHCKACKRKDFCGDPIAWLFQRQENVYSLCCNSAQAFVFFAASFNP